MPQESEKCCNAPIPRSYVSYLLPLLVAIGAVVYLVSLRNSFVLWDDDVHITQNSLVTRPGLAALREAWKGPTNGLYMPLTYTFWIGISLLGGLFGGGLYPSLFHAASVLLHLCNAALLFLILGQLVASRKLAFLGALFFLLHPIQVEATAWVSGVKDPLACLFALSATLAYLTWRSRKGASFLFFAALAYGLALLSKPSTVILPVLLLAFHSLRGELSRASLAIAAGALTMAVPIAWITMRSQPETWVAGVLPLWARILVAGDALSFYTTQILLPLRFAPDYGRLPSAALATWAKYSWIAPTLILWLTFRRARHLAIPFSLFLLSFLPVLGLHPFFFQNYSTVSDRYAYLPMCFAAWAFAEWIGRWQRPRPALLTGLFCLLAMGTLFQITIWKNSTSLFLHTIRINPRSFVAHNNLGSLLEKQNKMDEAAHHYLAAIEADPKSVPPRFNLGRILAMKGLLTDAAVQFRFVIEERPDVAEAHYQLGRVMFQLGSPGSAKQHFERALALDPRMQKAADGIKMASIPPAPRG